MKQLLLTFLGIIFLSSCIGNVLIEEAEVPEQFLISTTIFTIKVEEQLEFFTIYTNKYGMTENKQIIWDS